MDGKNDEAEENFDKKFCPWEMVSGPSGTYLRTIDVEHDLGAWFGQDDIAPDQFMRSWFYDSAIPIGIGDEGAPEHPNKWSLCSARLDHQVKLCSFLHCQHNMNFVP